jgi:hypothetical protein
MSLRLRLQTQRLRGWDVVNRDHHRYFEAAVIRFMRGAVGCCIRGCRRR